MKRLTKILIIGTVAVIVIALFTMNVGYYTEVDDINDADAYDNVDTDGDGTANVDDDDVDGDGITNDVDADDDNDDITDDEDEDPVIPSDDENNNDVPDVLEPIASFKISNINIRAALVYDSVYGLRLAYPSFVDHTLPTIDVVPYTGDGEPIYEWTQVRPLLVSDEGTKIEYSLRVNVYSDFESTEYVYVDDNNRTTTRFNAVWFSETYTKSIPIYNLLPGDTMADIPSESWITISLSTGNGYVWESGGYIVNYLISGKVVDTGQILRSSMLDPDPAFEVVM